MRVVRPGEYMVVRRFGRFIEPGWKPGLHFGLPMGLDRFDRVRLDEVRRQIVGSSGESEGVLDPSATEFLTGDLNLVRIQAVVQYRVDHPANHLVSSEDSGSLLSRLAEASLTRSLARRGIDGVLRSDRPRISDEVASDLRRSVEKLRLGLQILSVSLVEARPPAEVSADFAAAQSAESRRNRRATEARTLAETTVTAARVSAHSRLEDARAEGQRRLVGSRAEAQRFAALLLEAERARSLTVRRVYTDTMKSLLGSVRRKIILPPGDAVDLTVLGLDE
jgi:membrane protease subunit HflK